MDKHLGILIACHTAKVPILYLSPQQQAGMSKAHLITEKSEFISWQLFYGSYRQSVVKTAGDGAAFEKSLSSSLGGLCVCVHSPRNKTNHINLKILPNYKVLLRSAHAWKCPHVQLDRKFNLNAPGTAVRKQLLRGS